MQIFACVTAYLCFIAGDLVKNAATVITKWKKLLKYYLPSVDEEVGLLIFSSDPDEVFYCSV